MADDYALSFFDPQPACDVIRGVVPELVAVGTARDFGNASAETVRTPSAWVIIMSEAAGPNRYEACDLIEQLVTVRVGVVLAVRDLADRTGTRAGADLRAVREPLHRAFCAWVPIGAEQAMRFERGALASGIGRDGLMFWQDEFTAQFPRRLIIGG